MNRLDDHFTPGKLFRFVIPMIFMMIFMSIYYIVDGYFVSNYVGKTPFAGLNVIFPALMMFSSTGFMFSSGGSALVSKILGEKKEEEARATFSTIILACLVLSILLSMAGYLLTPALTSLMGAEGELYEYSVMYGHLLFPALLFFVMQNTLQGFMVAAGKGSLGFRFILISGITNMILDALFVAHFQWGLPGAAYATIIAQVIGGILPVLYFFIPRGKILYFTKPLYEIRPVLQSMYNGVSNLLTFISGPLVNMLYNYELLMQAGEDGLAAYSVISYISFLFDAVFIGYCDSLIPVIAYQYGARNRKELSYLLHINMKILPAIGLSLFLFASLSAPLLADIFVGYDENLASLTTGAFRLYSFTYILAGFSKYGDAFFTALNNGAVSAVISFSHTPLLEVFFIMVLPLFFGINGLWFSLAATEICATLVVFAFLKTFKKEYGY